jgi:hypothetical protein
MLTDIISPEIYNDEFYHSLKTIIEYFNIKNILEIGASSGQGSTQCFLQSKNNECKLFSIEISKERFAILSNNNYQNFYPYLGSSIDVKEYMTDDEVKNFYNSKITNINNYSLDLVLSWKKEELDYISNNNIPTNIIQKIKSNNNIDHFDLVLIDGSPFTGDSELKQCLGSNIIALDDVNDIKCYQAYNTLNSLPEYELIAQNWGVRNGFAIFKLKQYESSI